MTAAPAAAGRAPVWRLAGAVAVLQALAFADRFLLSLLATPVSRSLGIDDFRLGLLQGTAFILAFVLATPVFGRLADRWPARRLLLIGLGLWTLATAAAGLATDYAQMLAARLLLAVGEAAVAPVGLVLIARATPPQRLARATSLFAGAGPFGKGLALVGGGAVLALAGGGGGRLEPWRELHLLAATLTLVAGVALWPWLRPEAAAQRPPEASAGGPCAPLLGEDAAGLLWLGAAGCATVLAAQTVGAWTPAFYHRVFGLGVGQAGQLAGLPLMLAGPLGGGAAAVLLDRRGARAAHALALAALLSLAAVAAAGAFSLRPLPAALAAYVALTALLGGATATFLAAMQRRQPPGRRGEFTAWVVAVPNLVGFGVGPALAGLLSGGRGGAGGAIGPALTAVVCAACATGASAALLSRLASARRWRRGAAETA